MRARICADKTTPNIPTCSQHTRGSVWRYLPCSSSLSAPVQMCKREPRTKDFCSSQVPHTNLLHSALLISFWTLPSSGSAVSVLPLSPDTRAAVSQPQTLNQKKHLFSFLEYWISSSWRLYFQPICPSYSLDFVFMLVAQSGSGSLEEKKCIKQQQKLAWSCSSSLHCRDRVCPGQLQIGCFFRGGGWGWGWRQCRCASLPSAVRMSVSAALE